MRECERKRERKKEYVIDSGGCPYTPITRGHSLTHPHKHCINIPSDSGTSTAERERGKKWRYKKFEWSSPEHVAEGARDRRGTSGSVGSWC